MHGPRGFLVLGERFSVGWVVLGAMFVLALGLATAQEEREADRDRAELRAQAAAAADIAERCLDDELSCEAVLASCTQVLAGDAACSCWFDDDGARR